MFSQDSYRIEDTIKLLKCFHLNSNLVDSKITIGFVFSKSKSASKKKMKTEQSYLTELGKESFFFPNFFGKSPTIVLFTTKNIDKSSMIDYIGSEDLIKKIEEGNLNPNYLVVLKEEANLLTKYSRILGPKGLMPSPKQGTIIDNQNNILNVIETLKKGSLKIKVNKYNMIQMSIGNINMKPIELVENVQSLLGYIKNRLPVSYRKTNLKKIYITSTHGPSYILNNLK